MLLQSDWGGPRNNLSQITSVVDVSERIQNEIRDILARGLRFSSDRVEFYFHTSSTFLDTSETSRRSELFTLDKILDKAEIEAINKWLLDITPVYDTEVCVFSEIFANHILKQIAKEFDQGDVARVIIHFTPVGLATWADKAALLAYGCIYPNNIMRFDTAFYIENIYFEEE